MFNFNLEADKTANLVRKTLKIIVAVFVFGLLLTHAVTLAAGDGTITALTATNSNPSTISATLDDVGKPIVNSNVRFQVFDKNNVLVGTYGPVSITLAAGGSQVVNWAWSVNGPGPYTVTACWSPGNSSNCAIDSKTTSFSAVPSLGLPLGLVAVLLIGVWFWRARRPAAFPAKAVL